MRSSSLELVKEKGIPSPQCYRDSLIHDWYIPPPYFNYVEIVYQDVLSTTELFEKIKDGIIYAGKLEYHVVWIHRPATVRKEKKAVCSFRYCFLLKCGYVLIKEFKEN